MRARVVALTLLVLGAVPPAAALAAGPADPRFAARALAEHGYALYQAGKYQEAIEVLQEAEKLYHAPTLVFAIARAQAGVGKLVQARKLLVQVIEEKLAHGAPPAFTEAQHRAKEELAALDQRIPTLALAVRGGGGRGLRVTLDDVDIPLPDRPIPLDPGTHRVTVAPMGGVGVSRTVDLREGARERLDIELPGAAPAVVPMSPGLGDLTARPWFVPSMIAFGVGVAGLGLGAGAGVVSMSKTSTIKKDCVSGHCPAGDAGAISSAKALAAASDAGFALAALGVATGVVLLVVQPGKQATRTAIVVGPGWAGVTGEIR